MRLTVPPMKALMDDPVYRAYMKKAPPMVHALTTPKPWQLWVRLDGSWKTGLFDSYREVWPVFVKQFRAGVPDVTITSRRVFYAPPGEWYNVRVRSARKSTPGDPSTTQVKIERRWRSLFHWEAGLEWCGRCRRPVYWQPLYATHHALRRLPTVAPDDNLRCIICGIRWVAMPSVATMEKLA